MRKSEIIIGSIVLGVGALLLIGALFDVDIWGLICPAGLIALGVWLIYQTRKDPREGEIKIRFVGDIRRRGVWQSESEEIWAFVLDTVLDFTEADLPDGETTFRYGAFVNDIKVTIPSDIGVAVESMAFMTETRIFGASQQTFVVPYTWQSDNFASSLKKVIIKPMCFVAEVKIKQSEPNIDEVVSESPS
jgi:predicted membrane protein